MTLKAIAHRIDPSLRRSTGPSCRGGASSLLRLARPGPQAGAGTRRPNWLQRAAAYFRSPAVRTYPAFGVSEYGVGSTG